MEPKYYLDYYYMCRATSSELEKYMDGYSFPFYGLLESYRYCPQCIKDEQKDLIFFDNSKYCPQCGTKLSEINGALNIYEYQPNDNAIGLPNISILYYMLEKENLLINKDIMLSYPEEKHPFIRYSVYPKFIFEGRHTCHEMMWLKLYMFLKFKMIWVEEELEWQETKVC